jgi:hypothetical protein
MPSRLATSKAARRPPVDALVGASILWSQRRLPARIQRSRNHERRSSPRDFWSPAHAERAGATPSAMSLERVVDLRVDCRRNCARMWSAMRAAFNLSFLKSFATLELLKHKNCATKISWY